MSQKIEPQITESEWLAALEECRPKPPPGGKCISEICKLWNLGEKQTRRNLTVLEAKGKFRRGRFGAAVYWYPAISKMETPGRVNKQTRERKT